MAWNIDTAHSEVTFSVRHMMVSKVTGSFNVFKGSLEIDENNLAGSWVEAEADASSVDTRDDRRDGHLRSPDFFDAEQYPVISFKSKKIEKKGDNEYKVLGDLTMHGVTKEVVFDADYAGQVAKDPFGLRRAGLSATTTINRKDFGLGWNQTLEAGGVMVGENVKIEISLEAVQPQQ
ncbi:MAG TPA: YceI family protein [Ktedonobacteraceae bacterium]|nr:YceI family protein [Ktedonobacteraceae bacterium]